jgi:hypothetical protein
MPFPAPLVNRIDEMTPVPPCLLPCQHGLQAQQQGLRKSITGSHFQFLNHKDNGWREACGSLQARAGK